MDGREDHFNAVITRSSINTTEFRCFKQVNVTTEITVLNSKMRIQTVFSLAFLFLGIIEAC